jgi:hypothetical protein
MATTAALYGPESTARGSCARGVLAVAQKSFFLSYFPVVVGSELPSFFRAGVPCPLPSMPEMSSSSARKSKEGTGSRKTGGAFEQGPLGVRLPRLFVVVAVRRRAAPTVGAGDPAFGGRLPAPFFATSRQRNHVSSLPLPVTSEEDTPGNQAASSIAAEGEAASVSRPKRLHRPSTRVTGPMWHVWVLV